MYYLIFYIYIYIVCVCVCITLDHKTSHNGQLL